MALVRVEVTATLPVRAVVLVEAGDEGEAVERALAAAKRGELVWKPESREAQGSITVVGVHHTGGKRAGREEGKQRAGGGGAGRRVGARRHR